MTVSLWIFETIQTGYHVLLNMFQTECEAPVDYSNKLYMVASCHSVPKGSSAMDG